MRRLLSTRRSSAIAVALLLVTGGYVAPPRVDACLPPPDLSDYIRAADAIVIGHALDLREEAVGEGDEPSAEFRAVLRSETVLKKNVEIGPTIEFEVGAHDAETFVPSQGVRALVLLTYDEEAERLATLTVRPLADLAAERVYAARVREMLDLLEISDVVAQRRQLIEWCVRCIEEEPTRNDGVATMPYGAWRSPDETGENDGHEAWNLRLTDGQWERVMAVFFDGRDAEEAFAEHQQMLGLLGERRDPRVIGYLERALWRNLDSADEAGGLMYLLAESLDWKTGRDLVSRFQEAEGDARQELLSEYLRMLPGRVEYPTEPEEEEATEAAEEASNDVESVDEEVVVEEEVPAEAEAPDIER
jgi:hypothetical protein